MNLRAMTLSMALLSGLQAQELPPAPPMDGPLHLPRLAWEDTKAVVLAPGAWKAPEWSLVALGAASVGLAFTLDRRVDDAVLRHPHDSWDSFSRKIETLGGVGGLVLVGGLYGGGLLADQPELRAMGADAGIAILISRVAMDLPIKTLSGRSRPMDEECSRHFQIFGHGDSFPSGHATQAFAIASVVAAHTESLWLAGGVYGMASLVGLARVERREHYLSDVLVGALLGTAVGKIVVSTNRRLRRGAPAAVQISFLPTLGPGSRGLAVSARF